MSADEWIDTTIGEQATLQRGKDITRKEQRPGNIPVVSSGGVGSYHDNAFQEGPGVVLGRKGVVGSVWFIDEPYWPHDTTLWVKDFHGNDQRFVYYFFKSKVRHLARLDVGTANPTLNRNHVHPIKVKWPPLPEQRAIASILGALDDKIELNRRMNATLESPARAIFKSWFVDFDPVKINAGKINAGQMPASSAIPTTHDPKVLDLFPSTFQDSELGPIPEGWAVKKIGDFITRHPVGTKYNQKTVEASGTVPVLDQGKSGIIGFHNDEPGVLASLEEPKVVFANHTCYMRLITFPFSAIQNVLPFTGNGVDTVWAFYATEGVQGFIEYKGHWPDFIINETVVPPDSLTIEYKTFVQPIIAEMERLTEESLELSATRDALLPQLLSGELPVPAALTRAEEALA